MTNLNDISAILLPADWVLIVLVITMTVMGMFRGFSGTLAFMLALVAAGIASFHAWDLSLKWSDVVWLRGGVTLVATLLAFGIVRIIVKKIVNGLLAQPSDAIFGALTGLAAGLLVILGWAETGWRLDLSRLATEVAEYVR